MSTVIFDRADELAETLGGDPQAAGREVRLAAALYWCSRGEMSTSNPSPSRFPGRPSLQKRPRRRHLGLRQPVRAHDPEGAVHGLAVVVEEGELLAVRGPRREDVDASEGRQLLPVRAVRGAGEDLDRIVDVVRVG